MHIPAPERLITLTTDFGTRDGYAGAMKGVIRQIAPAATVEDITHGIPAGDIRAGAWALRTATPFYPRGSVHVVVVDPGVGTARHALVAHIDGRFYIGPDNGVFSWLLAEADEVHAWRLADHSWRPDQPSNTFHGRDLFAHAAALMVQEGELNAVCGEVVTPRVDAWATCIQAPGAGEVVHVDRFGNVVTNLLLPEEVPQSDWRVSFADGKTLTGLQRTYGEVASGACLALVGSHRFLEIAVRLGSASEEMNLHPGDQIRVAQIGS